MLNMKTVTLPVALVEEIKQSDTYLDDLPNPLLLGFAARVIGGKKGAEAMAKLIGSFSQVAIEVGRQAAEQITAPDLQTARGGVSSSLDSFAWIRKMIQDGTRVDFPTEIDNILAIVN